MFLWLLKSSSIRLSHCLPMLGSANTVDSVNSKIIGAVNRIDSNTNGLLFFFFFFSNSWVFSTQGLNLCLLKLLHCYVLGHYNFLFISTENLSNTPLYCILKVEFNLNVRSGLLVILGSCKEK